MMRIGYNTGGTETIFEQVLMERHTRCGTQFNYLEVGIAEGQTLSAVANLLSRQPVPWNCIGVDLVDGPYFNPITFLRQNRNLNIEILMSGITVQSIEASAQQEMISVVLLHGDQDVRKCKIPDNAIDFCLIDGCHGKPCVTRDFLAVEPWIAPGGIVAFHDAMPEDQGQGFQPHCQMPITVRDALMSLGLDSQTVGLNCSRSGWKFIAEAHGDKSACPPGNGFAFFQKNAVTEGKVN